MSKAKFTNGRAQTQTQNNLPLKPTIVLNAPMFPKWGTSISGDEGDKSRCAVKQGETRHRRNNA